MFCQSSEIFAKISTVWFDKEGNYFVGDSMGHFEKNVHIYMSVMLNGYWNRSVVIFKYKSIVNGNKEKLLRADCGQEVLAIIRCRIFCLPGCYPKI